MQITDTIFSSCCIDVVHLNYTTIPSCSIYITIHSYTYILVCLWIEL